VILTYNCVSSVLAQNELDNKSCPSWHSTYHVNNISSMKKELIAVHNLHFNVWWYTRPLEYISNLIWKQGNAKPHLPNLSSVPLATNLCIVKVVFILLHVRMFRCKQHSVYTSQPITRTVSGTVYGIYLFWLQVIYTWQSYKVEITFLVLINSFVNAYSFNELYLYTCCWMSVDFPFGWLKYLHSNF
jgi:hypothetical protein